MKRNKRKRFKNKQTAKKPTRRNQNLAVSESFKIKDFIPETILSAKKPEPYKLSLGLIGAIEQLQAIANKPITILKGYEQSENIKSKKNYHCLGLAADIRAQNMSIKELFLLAEKIPCFTGIGLNISENHLHVDKRPQERYLWVENNNEHIEITAENRAAYFENAT